MENIKKAKISYIVISAVMIALGIVMFIFPFESMDVICYLVGALILAFGVVKIYNYFSRGFARLIFPFDLGFGLLLIVLGILIIIHPNSVKEFLPVLVGIFWIVDGAMQLQNYAEARALRLKGSFWLLIFAVLTCVCGVLLIIDPFEGFKALVYVIGVTLVIDGLQNLFTAIYFAHFKKELKERVEKLDDDTTFHF